MEHRFLISLLCVFFFAASFPAYADDSEASFAVLNPDYEEVFTVDKKGNAAANGAVLTNGAGYWGSAPFVLGQNKLNRGMVITDKAENNPKNIYFGWNVGDTHEYAEIFAVHEGKAFKNLVLNPSGNGFVGIRTKNPSQPLQMGSGAYCSKGGVWTNASSRKYKTDIKHLTAEKAMDALTHLQPVEFAYKTDSEEKHVGFIAEDAPDLVASKNREGMSAMDVVAVLAKVIQEQEKRMQEQERIMKQQEQTIINLSKRIEKVENTISN